MPYYNLTNITNQSNFFALTEGVNEMSGGWLGIAIAITMTIIIFISLKDYPKKEAFAATAVISTILVLLFRVIGLVTDFVLFIYVIACAIAIVALLFNKG